MFISYGTHIGHWSIYLHSQHICYSTRAPGCIILLSRLYQSLPVCVQHLTIICRECLLQTFLRKTEHLSKSFATQGHIVHESSAIFGKCHHFQKCTNTQSSPNDEYSLKTSRESTATTKTFSRIFHFKWK